MTRMIPWRAQSLSSSLFDGPVLGRPARRSGLRLSLISREDPEEPFVHAPVAPDQGGRFHFTGLRAGSYVIVARGAPGEPSPELRLPVEVKEMEKLEVELRVE